MGLSESDRWAVPYVMVFRHSAFEPTTNVDWFQQLQDLFKIGYHLDTRLEEWFVNQVGSDCYHLLGYENPFNSENMEFQEVLALIGYRSGIFS